MGRKVKDNVRSSKIGFFDDDMAKDKGELFSTSSGGYWDSDEIAVLHHGIDTIKQLYTGLVITDSYQEIVDFYELGFDSLFNFGGYDWKVTSGRRGGYRFILKNEALGVLVLLGSFYCLPNLHGHHMKIELSPHFILSLDSDDIQVKLNEIAKLFITQVGYSGVAIHLCVDVQGWACPHDLDWKMTTKAKRIYKASGVSSVEFESHAITTVWGKGETFTFGGVSSLQFSVYNKSKQANDTGSMAFWRTIWNRETLDMSDNPRFDESKEVRRLEARFHHSVVAQFSKSCGKDLRSFYELHDHLTGLWQYAMNNFRLDDEGYINPFWQLIRDDLVFDHDLNSCEYIRCYEKLENTSDIPSERQVKIWFGITCSMFRRMKMSIEKAFNYLRQSGLYKWLIWYYPPYFDEGEDYVEDSGVLGALEYKLG